MTLYRKLHEAQSTFIKYVRSNPGTSTLAMLGGSTMMSIILFNLIVSDPSSQINNSRKEKMSIKEARLQAMLENAKENSWQRNLEIAAEAQDRFMIPNGRRDAPEFMNDIDKKSTEILEKQHAAIDEKKKQKDTTTRFWT